jgi:hypothetical protein
MPFTLMPRVVKSESSAHGIADGAEDFEENDGDSQMATNARKPLRSDDDAVKTARHPLTGQFVADQIPSGATHGPLAQAMAMHRPASQLTTIQAVGEPARAGSIGPEKVTVTQLDYRTGITPAPGFAPVQSAGGQS